MEKLLDVEGAIESFLMYASRTVNWEGSTTDIPRDKLNTIATAVKREFGIELNFYDINLTWAHLRDYWETWVRATHYVPSESVNATTGKIDISVYKWNQLLRVVPDSEVFQRECMISPNLLCSVFNQTPSSLAPEELHFRTYLNKSPEEVEEEIDACMSEVYKIDDLRTSHVYTAFCRLIFENTEIRKTFDCLPNEKLKCEYVLKKFNEMDGTL